MARGSSTVTVAGLGRHLAILLGRAYRPERAGAVGSPAQGVLYAFTWGMMPWAKESTRLHLLAYLRGVVFHIGIGAAFLALLVSPWRGRRGPPPRRGPGGAHARRRPAAAGAGPP